MWTILVQHTLVVVTKLYSESLTATDMHCSLLNYPRNYLELKT